ncbi:MAG: LuxR C-terminal-related transcriptional regulator [Alphaproteobacteria bacterium]
MRDISLARNEEARLAALRHYEILDTPEESAFDELARLASQICETPTANISLIDSDRAWFKATVGTNFKEVPRPLAFCNYAIGGQDLLFEVPNLIEDERFKNHPFVAGGRAIRFYAGAPLITAEGHRLGALFVVDFRPRQLTSDQRRALGALSRRVVAEMELRLMSRRFRKWTEMLLADAEGRSHQVRHRIGQRKFPGAAPHNIDNIRSFVMDNLDLLSIACDGKRQRQIVERAITAAQSGGDLARQLLASGPQQKSDDDAWNAPFNQLTPREKQILPLVAEGLSNRETARRLGLAEATVKVYMQRIFKKTGVKNRTSLAVLVARRRGSKGKATAKSSRN